MSVVRCLVLVCMAATGCGKVEPRAAGDGGPQSDARPPDDAVPLLDARPPSDATSELDRHLHVASGWSIKPLVDLTEAGFVYNASDFMDSGMVTNQPGYVAALYPPFSSSLAVLAGRTIIEIAADGSAVFHSFAPSAPDVGGPDMLGRATFANLGQNQTGLWVTSSSAGGGDGLYLIDAQWLPSRLSSENNVYALALDPTGAYDSVGSPVLYVSVGVTKVERWTTALSPVFTAAAGIDEFAVANGALFMTIEATDAVELDRVGPGPSYTVTKLATSSDIVLAEGATASGLFAIKDDTALVTIDQTNGAFTEDARTTDTDWQWRSVNAPCDGHPLAGKLIVLESNRTLNRDRLLLVTPPAP